MFAPVFHPAMAHAAVVRGQLRVPTAFNFLGPLTNPARPQAQIVGVSDPRMLPLVAEVLAKRGTRALVFRGEDGLDELTTTGPSHVYTVADGRADEGSLAPEDAGIPVASADDLKGGDVEHNVAIAHAVLAGEQGPARDVVLLNAGAALWTAGHSADLRAGVAAAAGSVDSGAAAKALDRWVVESNA
jgi:anthranilate phosphoribosyltransferase